MSKVTILTSPNGFSTVDSTRLCFELQVVVERPPVETKTMIVYAEVAHKRLAEVMARDNFSSKIVDEVEIQ
jgi:hypothetical protein